MVEKFKAVLGYEIVSQTLNISPWDSTRYVSAVLWLQSGFAPLSGNPHRLRVESATPQYSQQLASRDRGGPAIIT